MLIDVQIAVGLDREIDQRMPREQFEHVIEKAYAGSDVRLAGAIEVQFEPNVGLFGLAMDRSSTRHEQLAVRITGTKAEIRQSTLPYR
jgi:hypothetical protein